MSADGVLLLGGDAIRASLAGRERQIMDAVRSAYEIYGRGDGALPHSSFLRFPSDDRNRIIALPAYLGGDFDVAGIKWIASFPANIERGMDRASAAMILNSRATGRPFAVLEGSVISAKRTAASAALAAERLHPDRGARRAALVGCGLIQFEIARFLRGAFPELHAFTLFDTDRERAGAFGALLRAVDERTTFEIADDHAAATRACELVSFATTAGRPYLADPGIFRPGSTVLHVSLRDLAPEVVLSAVNVVDDVDHVCRADTSIHLTEQRTGSRGFIRCTLAEALQVPGDLRPEPGAVVVFSPFGLGVLDLAVGKLVVDEARRRGEGTVVDWFFPAPWTEAL